jgi:hypothetical protein
MVGPLAGEVVHSLAKFVLFGPGVRVSLRPAVGV